MWKVQEKGEINMRICEYCGKEGKDFQFETAIYDDDGNGSGKTRLSIAEMHLKCAEALSKKVNNFVRNELRKKKAISLKEGREA